MQVISELARNKLLLFSLNGLVLNTAFIFDHFLPSSDWDSSKKNQEKNLEQKQSFGLMVFYIWNVNLNISVSIHSKNNCLSSALSKIISQGILNALSISTAVISVRKRRFKRVDRTQEFKKEHLKLSYYFRVI